VVNLNQGEGYGHNFPTGADVNQTRQTLVRSKWLYTPTDDTTITAWFSYSDFRSSVGDSKQFLPGVTGLDGVTTYTGNWQNSTGDINPEIEGVGNIEALQIDHDFGPMSIQSISAYQHLDILQNFDNDLTPLPIIDVNINNQEYRTLTQELHLLSNKESAIKWIVGGFFMHDLAGYGGPIGLGLFGSSFGGGGVGLHNLITTTSYAGFGEITLPIVSDSTHLTVGARYTKDERVLSGTTLILNDITSQTVLDHIPVTPTPRADFSKPTFRGILDHRFNDQIMVYGGYSRGFKSGNFNNLSPTDPPYQPEVLDSIEIGAKTDLLDRHLRVDVSAFHYKYKNIQVGVSNGPTIITTNAAAATIKGVDINTRAVLNEYFDVNFGGEYLNGKINSFENAPFLYPNPNGIGDYQVVGNASGNSVPRSPKYTLNMAPSYTVPVPGGKLKATAALYYNAGFFWDFTNTRKQGAYTVLNASVGWEAASDKWGFRFFGSNLTNREYATFLVAQQPGDDYNAAPPRTFGIEFNFNLKPH
jgi:iron complex outermembrane recepter protein